jgi:regulator of protease activity HflC (stomatin/prohibitin superfamily)
MYQPMKTIGKAAAGVALATALYFGAASAPAEAQERYGRQDRTEQAADPDYIKYGIEGLVGLAALGAVAGSFRVVRQNERGLVERFGKYTRLATPGLNFVMPLGIEKVYRVNITEQMVNADPQMIITSDKLNATVDAQVYFKVNADEESVKNSQYNVYDYKRQIVQLARTTPRNIIGSLSLTQANSDRNKINTELMKTLSEETKAWGLNVVRTELKEIDPPEDVQATMNKVVKAENERVAAVDLATAAETVADGARRAAIKQAEGLKQAAILDAQGYKEAREIRAEGDAKAMQVVNDAANKYFVGNAQTYKRLEVTQAALANNAKLVVPAGTDITAFITGDGMTALPVDKKPRA